MKLVDSSRLRSDPYLGYCMLKMWSRFVLNVLSNYKSLLKTNHMFWFPALSKFQACGRKEAVCYSESVCVNNPCMNNAPKTLHPTLPIMQQSFVCPFLCGKCRRLSDSTAPLCNTGFFWWRLYFRKLPPEPKQVLYNCHLKSSSLDDADVAYSEYFINQIHSKTGYTKSVGMAQKAAHI